MALTPGTKLGPYEIVAPLGAGGMGEVYRARDQRLGREVAIKVLPEAFAADPERLARFEREARLLAALDHPNIARILGLEELGGARGLVLELAEGDDLTVRLGRGALPLDDALAIALQIARALEHAHERGIVHRDLKPANVKVGSDGAVKVLDFGLARAFEGDAAAADPRLSQSPTMTRDMTVAGVILGTAAYMSPEQARGRTADRRADIWSFGVVMYEMFTGARPFAGETVSEILASVIKDPVDFAALPSTLPPHVRALVERCLTRDPAERLRDIGEARIALSPAGAASSLSMAGMATPSVSAAPARRGVPLPVVALAVLAVAAAAWFAARAGKGAATAPATRLEIVAENLSTVWDVAPKLSPDGRRVAYCADKQLWVRELDVLEPRRVAVLSDDVAPCWSPDSRSIAYVDRKKLWKLPAAGGDAISLCDVPASGRDIGLTWSAQGQVAFSIWRDGIWIVSENGGIPRLFLPRDSTKVVDYHDPAWLPNGDLISMPHWTANERGSNKPQRPIVFDGKRTHEIDVETDEVMLSPAFDGAGHLLFLCRGANEGVWGVNYDLNSRRASGVPFLLERGARSLSVSQAGAYVFTLSRSNAEEQEFCWLDLSGRFGLALGKSHRGLRNPRLSPDGGRLLFQADESSTHVWVADLRTGTETKLTFGEQNEVLPAWYPDASRLLYVRSRSLQGTAVAVNADGSGGEKTLATKTAGDASVFWIQPSPDGKRYVGVFDRNGAGLLRVAEANPDGTPGEFRPLFANGTEPDVKTAELSPDGSLLAYTVEGAERRALFVTRFPSGVGQWQVSVEGGRYPSWAQRTGELFYLEESEEGVRAMTRVAMRPVLDPPVGQRTKLFEVSGALSSSLQRGYAVSPDGQRLLLSRRSGGSSLPDRRLILVQNWRRPEAPAPEKRP
ncbi:MAG: serine/threonine-protein kinase [Candidatus Eisenbacteria bacterium]|nr:serine/threonine-protein kinase [Candidatus Eisenbacteria bacterium]